MMHAPLRTTIHQKANEQTTMCVSTMSVVVIVVCFTQPFTLSLLVGCHYLFALKATFALEVHVVITIWYFMNPFFLPN